MVERKIGDGDWRREFAARFTWPTDKVVPAARVAHAVRREAGRLYSVSHDIGRAGWCMFSTENPRSLWSRFEAGPFEDQAAAEAALRRLTAMPTTPAPASIRP